MTGPRGDIAALSDALAARAPTLAAELLPAGRRDGRNWRVGSLAGEPGGSLAVDLAGPHAGGWKDYATGEHGDALDLVAAVLFRGRLRDALDWTRAWLGIAPGTAPAVMRRPVPAAASYAPDDAERIERARKGWLASGAAPGTPAAAYLARRGLPHLACLPVLRWCAHATHPAGGRHPALVALVQDVEGTPTAIHRTHLTADGEQARHLTPRRTIVGLTRGGGVRLALVSPELVVGEGIESSASAGLLLDLPAWAALSTSGLLALRLPPTVRRVVIAADNDANGAGQRAAASAATLWRAEGRTVRIATPDTPGQDFNDLLQHRARAAEADHG